MVVDNDQFDVRVRLITYRRQTFVEVKFAILCWNDNGHEWIVFFPFGRSVVR